MNKITKILITIAVFTFIILYFIKGKENVGPVITENTECERLNEILKVRIQDYFSENLPTEDGIIKSVEITELINNKVLTSTDLSEVGTSCSGNIYASKSGTNYYFSNDVVCGACNINDLYGEWSEYTENKPNTSKTDAQVQTDLYYNYSDATPEYTPWTEWVETNDTKTSPTVPSGVEVIDTETEEKIQYSYRDGNFKWYKLVGGTSYYDGGTLVEKSPGSGYSKVEESKTYSRTIGPSTNKSDITSQTSGLAYDMETSTTYRTREVKNIYSRTVSGSKCTYYQNCTYSIPRYRCYGTSSGATTYTCQRSATGSAISSPDYYYSSSSEALSACASAGLTNCTTKSRTSGGTSAYSYTLDYVVNVGGSYYSCDIKGCVLPTLYSDSTCTGDYNSQGRVSVRNCMLNGSPSSRKCLKTSNSTYFTACWTGGNGCTLIVGSGSFSQCESSYSKVTTGGSTSYMYTGYSVNSETYTSSSGCGSDTQISVNTTPGSTVYGSVVTNYNQCTGATPYYENHTATTNTKQVSTCTSECTACTQTQSCIPGSSVSNPTVYYIKDKNGGTTTNLNEAIYLTESEYTNTGLTTYSPDNTKSQYASWSSYKSGSCPNNIITSTCDQTTSYQAKVYKFKWYKTSTASKSWYNSGEYLSYSPGDGYNADTGSVRWDKWTEYTDDKVEKSDTREVRTKTLKRMRTSYLAEESLKLDTWLPLTEFESKMGKTLAELSLDTNIKIQKKVFYRFRLIKE